MIILIITIIVLILSIIGYLKSSEVLFSDTELLCTCLTLICSIILITELLVIISKPIEYKDFKIEYDTVNQIVTSSEDIRDTNYSMKIIEINTEINKHKTYIDSKWVGIFFNKKIAELKLLEK